MMYLNTAVAHEVSAELARQELKPKVLTFWLGVGERKAAALCKGESVWTMAELEAVAEGMGVDLFEIVTRCAARLKKHQPEPETPGPADREADDASREARHAKVGA